MAYISLPVIPKPLGCGNPFGLFQIMSFRSDAVTVGISLCHSEAVRLWESHSAVLNLTRNDL